MPGGTRGPVPAGGAQSGGQWVCKGPADAQSGECGWWVRGVPWEESKEDPRAAVAWRGVGRGMHTPASGWKFPGCRHDRLVPRGQVPLAVLAVGHMSSKSCPLRRPCLPSYKQIYREEQPRGILGCSDILTARRLIFSAKYPYASAFKGDFKKINIVRLCI